MPIRCRESIVSIPLPVPITLDDFCDWGEAHGGHRGTLIRRCDGAEAAGHLRHSGECAVPLHKIAVSPAVPARFCMRIEWVTLVGRAVERIDILDIDIERTA